MDDKVFQAALAGLLHDVGKFAQRQETKTRKHTIVGEEAFKEIFAAMIPFAWQDDIGDAIKFHHSTKPEETSKPIVKVVTVADWLASAERLDGHPEQVDPNATPLLPITARVELDKESGEHTWAFPLKRLGLERSDLFPDQSISVGEKDYQTLWQDFIKEVESFPQPIDSYSRLAGFMSLVRQYTTHIPSATPWAKDNHKRTIPDVSLYDHLKVTAAIAPCLLCLLAEHPDHLDELHKIRFPRIFDDTRPVAQLISGDLSGIQSFIYRIAEPERDKSHRSTAKRLRGRSFYLNLLNELIVEWFLRELNLTPANALFVGGGRFDLLAPIDSKTCDKIKGLTQQLEKWLVDEFEAAIGLVLVTKPLKPADFKTLKRANFAIDEKLAKAKQKKFAGVLSPNFFEPVSYLRINNNSGKRVCRVCGLTPLEITGEEEEQTCSLCEQHAQMGRWLPKTRYIAHIYSASPPKIFKSEERAPIVFGYPINISIVLLQDGNEVDLLLKAVEQEGLEAAIYVLNDEAPVPTKEWPLKTAPAQRYLANTAPQNIDGSGLEFEQIAIFSSGTPLLGILKADVDHLGLIFSLGLERPTISRVAALSHIFDRFFSGYLNTLCRSVTWQWKERLANEEKTALEERATKAGEDGRPVKLDQLDSLFYTVYAGGDDLLIIGPWDQTIELASQLYTDFRAYTCQNPNITLSAGIALVKPHFPVQRFVELTKEALDASKQERNRITVFDQTAIWTDELKPDSFDRLLVLAHKLYGLVEVEKTMPRTLIHDMLRMRKGPEIKGHNGEMKPICTPQLLYLLTRRLPKEVLQDDKLRNAIWGAWSHIEIPLSYVSLKTRKE
ncbi:MAG: type III-A CRISPR-associated protein Cas10/Csm1 [Anaerolineae bacterium]|nr:type III-A CRISPR-associated protein Cas10/Csm1 [Anaerolineales bacterium]MCQ3978445.1 type III-A CRISPR-associated protein Cas10/Csm1 [Anaerolineae bacterium]